jgi:hypothetical protein
MKNKMRKLALTALLLFYLIQMVMVQTTLASNISDQSAASYAGLVALHVVMLLSLLCFLAFLLLAEPLAQRFITLFDSLVFALSFCWLVLALPVADVIPGYYTVNVLVPLALLVTDLWAFRKFSPHYMQLRSLVLRSKQGHMGHLDYNPVEGTHGRRGLGGNMGMSLGLGLGGMGMPGMGGMGMGGGMGLGSPEDESNLTSYSFNSTPHAEAQATAAAQQMTAAWRVSASADMTEVKLMPRDLDLSCVCDGFRVNLNALPEIDGAVPKNLDWGSFTHLEHIVDSSSCHIYTAFWGDLPVILKLIKEDRITSSVALAEFEVEESVLSRVRHPHIGTPLCCYTPTPLCCYTPTLCCYDCMTV